MTPSTTGTSPQVYARIAGLLYLVLIIAGAIGKIFIRGRLVVPGDAAATASNILGSPSLWRLGIAGDLPKLLGVLMQIAGACYLINSFALLLAPHLEARLFPAIMVPCFLAELSLALWLLIRGVSEAEWWKRASMDLPVSATGV